jgi:hypothetical protein
VLTPRSLVMRMAREMQDTAIDRLDALGRGRDPLWGGSKECGIN